MLDRRRVLQFVGEWALVAHGALLLAALGGRAWWALDLANHLVPEVAVLGLVGLLAAAWGRAPRLAGLLAVALAWDLARLVPERASPAPAGGVPLRLMVANVHTANTDHEAVLAAVRAADPDVVGFLEVNARWTEALRALRAERPFVVEEPREDNFGVALYSRVPLADLEVGPLASAAVPSVTVRVHGARLILTHPLPPIGGRYAAQRDEQLDVVARRRADDRTIVAGDLNATPWSAAFPGRRPGLRPGTWPSSLPKLLRIPIDHVLVGPAVRLERLRVGPDVGSDHLPVIADLVVPPA